MNGLLSATALVSCIVYAVAWDMDPRLLIAVGVGLIGLRSSFLRLRDLRRKKAALGAAISAYDKGLVQAFAELDSELAVDADA